MKAHTEIDTISLPLRCITSPLCHTVLAEFWAAPSLADFDKYKLIAIYCPYLIMPLLMLWRAASRSGGMFPVSPSSVDGKGEGGATGRSGPKGGYYANKDV